MIKMIIDGYRLLDTVSFICEKGKSTLLEIEDNVEGNMKFPINFLEDEKNRSTRLEYIPVDKFQGDINAYNFKGEQFINELMLLGSYKHDYLLYMQFSSRTIAEDIRQVTLSLYIKRQTNGSSKR